jgi:hypothetical protein
VPSFFRTPDAARPARPAPLLLGAALVGVQGLIGVLIGVAFMIGGVVGGPADAMDAQIIGALTLLMGAGLVAAARGLLRRRRAARAPALVWQLIMLGVGFSGFRENPALSVPLIVVGGLTTALIFHPATNEVLED